MDINTEIREFIVDVSSESPDHEAINKRLDRIVKRKLEQRYENQRRILDKELAESAGV